MYISKKHLRVRQKKQTDPDLQKLTLLGKGTNTKDPAINTITRNLARKDLRKTKESGFAVFYKDSTPNQELGVKIDIPVVNTIRGILEKKDEIPERAIRYIEEEGGKN
jgi:hypothetical protein